MKKTSVILSLFFAILSSCAHEPPPKWDGEIWTVDSMAQSCTRVGADGLRVFKECADPVFNGAALITDFENMVKMYYGSCVQWKNSN